MVDKREAVNTILAKVNLSLRKYLYLDEDFCVMLKATDPEVLSQNDHDEIKALQTRCAKIDFLIDMMKRKPVGVFLEFMNVLKEKDSDLYHQVKIKQDDYLPTHAPDSVENPNAGEIVLPVATTQDVKCDNHPNGPPQYIYCNTCQKQVCCNNMILLHHKDCRIITQAMDDEQFSTSPVAATPEKKSDKHPHETLFYESSIALSNEPELSILSDVRCDIWKQTRHFSTTPALRRPYAITIHPNGDVAVTHIGMSKSKAAIFSKDGHLQDSFKIKRGFDIAITLENKYIFPGDRKMLIYDQQGNPLEDLNIDTSDADNKPSSPSTLAVDSQGNIIAGLFDDTISIHNGNGHLISKFATPATPKKLDVTSKGDIVVLYYDDPMIQLMDYSGNNVRELKQPDEVDNDWEPEAVCCSKQNEVFILNSSSVYRYTCTADDDQYHGSIIISGLNCPRDIAITADGQHLYVVEGLQPLVKIFNRPDNSAPSLD